MRALADGSAWIGITNLGTDDRVKDAGGPVVKPAYPKEGTVGFIDSEQMVKASKNKDSFARFINAMQQAPCIAQNFLTNGRPLFNEKAYKMLVNQGHGDRAHRLLYNQPEKALADDAQGPGRQRAGVHRRLQRGVRRLDTPGSSPGVQATQPVRHSAAAGSPRARGVDEPARRIRGVRPRPRSSSACSSSSRSG